MNENDRKELYEDIFMELNCYEIDASEVQNGRTYIDSREAEVLSNMLVKLFARREAARYERGRNTEVQVLSPVCDCITCKEIDMKQKKLLAPTDQEPGKL